MVFQLNCSSVQVASRSSLLLCVSFLVLGEGGEEVGGEGESGQELDNDISDLDLLLRKEREREKKRKVEEPEADEVATTPRVSYRIFLLWGGQSIVDNTVCKVHSP